MLAQAVEATGTRYAEKVANIKQLNPFMKPAFHFHNGGSPALNQGHASGLVNQGVSADNFLQSRGEVKPSNLELQIPRNGPM